MRAMCWALALAASASLSPSKTFANDRDVLVVTASAVEAPTVNARVNGAPLRLIIASDGPRAVLLNPDAAERAGVRANPVLSRGVSFNVGGDSLRGRTGRTGIHIEDGPRFRQRIIWFPGMAFTDEADGFIGAAAIRNLDRLTIEIERDDGQARQPDREVRFDGERGFEWRARIEAAPRPYNVDFSLNVDTRLTARGARLMERAGVIAARDDALRMTRLWFIGDSLAFSHENVGFSINGLQPERFARFARAEEIEAHQDRLALEAQHGPIETITVRASGPRPDDDPIKVTLGRDFLLTCARMDFDYRTDAISLTCPASTRSG
jgi:hypothetical protein